MDNTLHRINSIRCGSAGSDTKKIEAYVPHADRLITYQRQMQSVETKINQVRVQTIS